MGVIRTTITLDEALAAKVRQMFAGNLSRGVNELLFEHVFKENRKSAYGILAGKNYLKDLNELEKEDETGLKKLEKLHR